MISDTNALFWDRQTRRLQVKTNAGFWLQYATSHVLILAVILAPFLLWAREREMSASVVWGCLGSGLFLCLLISFFRARMKFHSHDQARVELEFRLGLHNRLTSASLGVGSWPPEIKPFPRLLDWKWQSLLPFPSVAVGVLIVAAAVPLPENTLEQSHVFSKPPGLNRLESWLRDLKEEEIVEEEAMENLEERVDHLASRDPKEWYRHGTLEAIDTLEERTRAGLESVYQNSQSAQSALSALREPSDQPEARMRQLSQQLGAAIRGLENGTLPLNEKLLSQLKDLDPSALKKMDPKKLQQMMDKLDKSAGTCKRCLGEGSRVSEFPTEEPKFGERPGNGGIDRGPGTVPLTLNPNASEAGSRKTEGVSNKNLEHATFGRLLGVSDAEPQVGEKKGGLQAGGKAGSVGKGGESVWTESLKPEERDVVKRYFK